MKIDRKIPIHDGHSAIATPPLIVLVSLLLTACASNGFYELNLMPAPEIYQEETISPFTDDGDAGSIAYDGILYATDREPVGEDSEEARKISLLKNRGRDYPLSITDAMEFGVLESSRSNLFESERNLKEKSGNKAFAVAINRQLAISQTKDVFVYIHGYKVVFSNPLLVATELWHFLGYDGAFISYAWPSTPDSLAYAKDLETAAYSSRNLRLLLEYLAKETDARRIHILAYSAGTRVAIDALGQLALLHAGDPKDSILQKLRIRNVILVGSDYDRDIFFGLLGRRSSRCDGKVNHLPVRYGQGLEHFQICVYPSTTWPGLHAGEHVTGGARLFATYEQSNPG